MNTGNEQFERDFEAFLHDDGSHLSALYRKLPQAEPDAQLDAVVRAMARRAVAATPRHAPTSRRWMPAIGIAAVLALAAGISLRLAPQLWQRPQPALSEESIPAPVPPTASGMAAKPSAQAPAAADAVLAKRASDAGRAPEAERQRFENRPPPPPMPQAFPVPAPAAAPAPKPMLKQAPAAQSPAAAPPPEAPAAAPLARDEAAASAGSLARPEGLRAAKTLSAAPAEAGAETTDANASLYPEHWLANIRQMLREHRRDEALRSLDRFRKKYPDYPLPDDLRDLR
jgi:hypothetical protein